MNSCDFHLNRYNVFGRGVQSYAANRRRLNRSNIMYEQNIGRIRLRVCHNRFRILFGLVIFKKKLS